MTTDIEPALNAEGPPMRTMKGPSAFSGGWRRFWALTWMVAITEFRLTYFGSVLGYFWTLMRPLMMFGVYYVVFTQIVNLGDRISHYPALLLTNIMMFLFFSEATTNSVMAVVGRENLVRKMEFPRMVIPVSVVVTAALNLAVNMIAVLAFVLANGVQPRWTWVFAPFVLIPLVMLSAGMAMILSAAYVRYRDVLPIWSVFTQALFYASPILYTIEVADKPAIREVLSYNPLTGIIAAMRYLLIDEHAPGPISSWGGFPHALAPIALIVFIFCFGIWYFNRQASHAAELL